MRRNPAYDLKNPPGQTVNDYVQQVQKEENGCEYCSNGRCNWMCETALLDAPLKRPRSEEIRDELVTPRDWQQIAQKEATELLGTHEGAAKLVEAKRYGVLADKIERLTKPSQVCYTITTGMCLRDLKDGIGQAYWNRDRETLDRLLESLQPAS